MGEAVTGGVRGRRSRHPSSLVLGGWEGADNLAECDSVAMGWPSSEGTDA